ncbi:MAG: hypothetical protein WAM13_19170 [Candidatus Sulfotelmatobacter sp.]
MTFFDRTGRPISYQGWVGTYQPSFFLGGPPLGRSVNRRNQSSQWIENQIDALLMQLTPLSQADLTLGVAWKIGAINHTASASSIHWEPASFPTALIGGRYKWNFSQSIPYLATNMSTIVNQLAVNPAYLLNLKLPGTGFGPTNKLAIHFLITHGSEPIYDIYAHKGALAIDQSKTPGQPVTGYSAVQSWGDFQNYKSLLRRIGLQPHGSMFISRNDDRALWAYGHLFK